MRVQIVSFRCVLKNKLGHLISTSTNQDVVASYPLENEEDIEQMPGFIQELKGLKAGERKQFSVPAERAYGFYDPTLVFEMPRSKLSKGKSLKVGDEVSGYMREDGVSRSFRVTEAAGNSLTLDGNHPLAGQDLEFDIEVTSSHEENEAEDDLFTASPEGLPC